MPFLFNDPISGAIAAKLTATGRRSLLENGKLNIDKFRLFDTEILYPLFNPDNIDQDDADITSLAIFDGSPDANATEYDHNGSNTNILLHKPYYIQQQRTVVGNKIIDNPFFIKNNDIVLDIKSLTGDKIDFGNTTPLTGVIINTNNFYNIKVNVGDVNNSVLNGSILTLYQNGVQLSQQTISNNTFVIFSNLTSNLGYKINAQNSNYAFANDVFGGPTYSVSSLQSNIETTFIGTPLSISAASYTISGTVTNGISLGAVSGLRINLHYQNISSSASTNGSGIYSFTGLSGGIQYFVYPSSNVYYLPNSTGTSGVLTANRVHSFSVFPISKIDGNVYYYNTTNPISNAIVNLYQGTSSANSNLYLGSVLSDQNGYFNFPNILLSNDYFIKTSLQDYTFTNIPYVLPSSSVTASITGIIIYGKKQERPFIFDSPFPIHRRLFLIDDKSIPGIFYDPCSWVFYTLKYGILGYDVKTNYSPIFHEQVLKSNNYFDLIQTLSGPYEFTINSKQKFIDRFGNESYSAYVSDNYLIKIGIYALPYQYTVGNTILQWDEFSKTDLQTIFPLQINTNANGFQLTQNSIANYIDEVPQFENSQIALNLNDINKLSSLLPRTNINVPITVSTNNSIPNLGLILSNSFNIDNNILNVVLNPSAISQNPDYVSYASVKGTERTIPVQTVVTDFENISTTTIDNQINKQVFNISNAILPIFIPEDASILNSFYTNNLTYGTDFPGFINQIRNSGYIFDRVIAWSASDSEYSATNTSAYLTINTFGNNNTLDQLLFLENASHYKISNDFIQFVLTYFGIPSTDQNTITKALSNNALIDWIFYIYIINYGAYFNGYNSGSLQTLLSLSRQSKFVILFDLIDKGKNSVQKVTDIAQRNYTPTQNALNFFTSQFPSKTLDNTVVNNTGILTNTNANTTQQQQSSALNVSSPNLNTSAIGNNTGNTNNASPNASLSHVPDQTIFFPSGSGIHIVAQPPVDNINQVINNQYALVTKELFRVVSTNIVNQTIQTLYGFTSFDYKVAYVIVIINFNKVNVVNTVSTPITKIEVQTQTITPIVERIINLTNVNNFFNLNSSLDKKIKLTLNFDLTNPATQDNFIKMINYLNDKLYTFYIGVEVIDQGQITKQLNNTVYTLQDYIQSSIEVQNAFCTNDKTFFLIPLTIGGLLQQTFSNVVVGSNIINDPVTFTGNGFIKMIPFNNDFSHLLRVIKLKDGTVNQINGNIVTGSDYVFADVLQVKNGTDLRQIKRYMQILNTYNYQIANQDINDLRNVLNAVYNNIPGITYIGNIGGILSSSNRAPNFWVSSLIPYQPGTTTLAFLNNILTSGNGQISDLGQVINSLSDFSII